jgi:hypothetical protein
VSTCQCAKAADEKLASMNTAVDWATLIAPDGRTESRFQIKTRKIDQKVRRGPCVLVATYCPFCGVKLS